jgi:hypothetical protein
MTIQVTASASLPPDVAFGRLARSGEPPAKPAAPASGATDAADSASSAKPGQLSAEAQQRVAQLKEIDRKVRAHEQAHMAVGGDLVRGGTSYKYQTGPDNQRYAVGGEVSIDASPASTPEKTIVKAERIRAAALAPADPSAQDQSVAAQASSMANEARVELSAQQRQEAAAASAARTTKANAAQGGTGFYRGVEQSGQQDFQLGALLDSFA